MSPRFKSAGDTLDFKSTTFGEADNQPIKKRKSNNLALANLLLLRGFQICQRQILKEYFFMSRRIFKGLFLRWLSHIRVSHWSFSNWTGRFGCVIAPEFAGLLQPGKKFAERIAGHRVCEMADSLKLLGTPLERGSSTLNSCPP